MGVSLWPAHQVTSPRPQPPRPRAPTTTASLQVSSLVSALPPQPPVSGKIDARVVKLLQEFPGNFYPPAGLLRPTHVIEHVIETTGRPVFAKPRRLDPSKLSTAKNEFSELEAAGIIRRSNSPWSSPLHMVPKKDSGWGPCRDYHCLNIITTLDRYPLPYMQDLNSHLAG